MQEEMMCSIVSPSVPQILFGQVDKQDVPITGQPSKRRSKNKKKKKQNDQTSKQSFLRDCTLFGCLPRLFPRW
jgi:hypothetical protein